MTYRVNSRNARRGAIVATLAVALTLFAPLPRAHAQEGETPSPGDVQKKIVEIEKLMKNAEASLARVTSPKGNAAETAAEAARRIEQLLEKKAQAETGKSCEQLRKEARDGSTQSAKTLQRLMKDARSEAEKAVAETQQLIAKSGDTTQKAAAGVRELIKSTRDSGKQAREGIEWTLENAPP